MVASALEGEVHNRSNVSTSISDTATSWSSVSSMDFDCLSEDSTAFVSHTPSSESGLGLREDSLDVDQACRKYVSAHACTFYPELNCWGFQAGVLESQEVEVKPATGNYMQVDHMVLGILRLEEGWSGMVVWPERIPRTRPQVLKQQNRNLVSSGLIRL
mmetsp:Transcript_50085/g.119163  ORF Transcript_50085/g.119163 Transcript_50085/m.119163 type:complete len:159 (+) Transcript_50085:121-597(+)